MNLNRDFVPGLGSDTALFNRVKLALEDLEQRLRLVEALVGQPNAPAAVVNTLKVPGGSKVSGDVILDDGTGITIAETPATKTFLFSNSGVLSLLGLSGAITGTNGGGVITTLTGNNIQFHVDLNQCIAAAFDLAGPITYTPQAEVDGLHPAFVWFRNGTGGGITVTANGSDTFNGAGSRSVGAGTLEGWLSFYGAGHWIHYRAV